jgi:hypothetical protein
VVLSREFEKGRDAYIEQMVSIPVKMAGPRSSSILTNSGIEVGDDCSECDDYQLDGLLPFGPLNVIRSISPSSVILSAQTDILRVFRVVARLRPEDSFSVW